MMCEFIAATMRVQDSALRGEARRHLARDLGVAESKARRMLNPEHATKATTNMRELRQLGKLLTVAVGEAT